MSITNQPTIYNTPTIYNAGGGGGGEPAADPELYKVYIGLQRKSYGGLFLTGTHFKIKDDDKIVFDIYFTGASYCNIFHTNGRLCALQKSGTSLRVYGFASSEYFTIDIPGWYNIQCQENHFNVNGQIKNIGSFTPGEYDLDAFFADGAINDNSVLFDFVVIDNDGNTKYKFVPALRFADNKKGMYELYTETFLAAPDDWALLMG